MSEPRKNHLNIDGGQVKEDGHAVDSYKPIPETDKEFPSKPTLSKSKEKISDEAEESLLQKEERPRITNNDMADAKYVVGDHRNGDTKVHIVADGAKKQFSGLTQEELKKYADDPFWVRLRWFMFILFWALWLCMLAGAIAIIIRAPKCSAPPSKNWLEKGPGADRGIDKADYSAYEAELPDLATAKVQGLFINPCEDTYQVLENDNCLNQFKNFLEKAKKYGIKLIVDLTANFVSKNHTWFIKSENKTEGFADFFVWKKNTGVSDNMTQVSPASLPNWSWSTKRQEYYLNQFPDQVDLNFNSEAVVAQLDAVVAKWMQAGASGVRLLKARQLVVNKLEATNQTEIKDQPGLSELFKHLQHIIQANSTDEAIFTIYEDGTSDEWYRVKGDALTLRPPFANPIALGEDVEQIAADIHKRVSVAWPALKFTNSGESEIAAFAMLLPAAPILAPNQVPKELNATLESEKFSLLTTLREDPSIQHGHYEIAAVPSVNATDKLLACTRWKSGHTGYLSVYNPWQHELSANLTSLQTLPDTLSVYYMSSSARQLLTNVTKNVEADDVKVPGKSTVVLSYVPKLTAEQ